VAADHQQLASVRLVRDGQNPNEVNVVIDAKRNLAVERVCAALPTIHYLRTPVPGKRNAVRVGVEHSTQPIRS
jgi:hyaluronan synthase